MPDERISRRRFLESAVAGSATLALPKIVSAVERGREARASGAASMIGVPFPRMAEVRVGLIGVGGRGSGLLGDLLAIEGVRVTALCDIVPGKVARGQAQVTRRGQKEPAGYSKGERDFENLCRRDDVDLVYIATPWEWHVPMALSAMDNGKHAAVEVPAATTLEECWQLVETSERTRRHCMMLENCCYGHSELMVLNMVRDGLLGELTHGEAAYLHDLRGTLFSNGGEGLWRRFWHSRRDGNLYPTHGLGPVAHYLAINRGDRFDFLVSVSSPSLGLQEYGDLRIPESDPRRREKFVCGDMNTSILKTALGRTVMLQHNVVSPRPYSRLNTIAGTKGIFTDYPARVFLDGQRGREEWQTLEPFRAKYEHALWRKVGEIARSQGGHGGMDYIMSYRLIQCVREGLVPDMDVYDAAAWSAPGPLSTTSVAHGSAPQKFPDFTRGRWREKRPDIGS